PVPEECFFLGSGSGAGWEIVGPGGSCATAVSAVRTVPTADTAVAQPLWISQLPAAASALGLRRGWIAAQGRVGFCKRRSWPQPDRAVGTGGGQEIAVGRERHRRHLSAMALERGHLRLHGDVPKLDRAVATTGGHSLAVGSKGQGPDPIDVSCQA